MMLPCMASHGMTCSWAAQQCGAAPRLQDWLSPLPDGETSPLLLRLLWARGGKALLYSRGRTCMPDTCSSRRKELQHPMQALREYECVCVYVWGGEGAEHSSTATVAHQWGRQY